MISSMILKCVGAGLAVAGIGVDVAMSLSKKEEQNEKIAEEVSKQLAQMLEDKSTETE